MKKPAILLLLMLFITIIISCDKEKDNIIDIDPDELTNPIENLLDPRVKSIVESDNTFGFKIFKEIAKGKEENICISPLSIAMCLSMLYNGAETETKREMEETLELLDLSVMDVNKSYRALIDSLRTNDPGVLFEIANSIWGAKNFDIEDEFIRRNEDYFDAEVSQLDFGDPGAVDIINNWVSDKTHQKIETILSKTNSGDLMYLINAIYFKGRWLFEFDPDKTFDGPFTLNNGERIRVAKMHQQEDFNYLYNDLFSSVELLYGSGNFSMHILLPHNNLKVDDIIENLNNETWNQWLTEYVKKENYKIYIPKFKFEYKKSLIDDLKTLGMNLAFNPMADFSGINKNCEMWISLVKHKTFIEVNEEGTEAAAVTIIGAWGSSLGYSVNRPFIFIIKERTTNTILFIGKVMNP
ncbi:serpin family protein, partial [Bacteroidota bacterium]